MTNSELMGKLELLASMEGMDIRSYVERVLTQHVNDKGWKETAILLLKEGKTHKEIAEIVGKSTKSIQRLVKSESL